MNNIQRNLNKTSSGLLSGVLSGILQFQNSILVCPGCIEKRKEESLKSCFYVWIYPPSPKREWEYWIQKLKHISEEREVSVLLLKSILQDRAIQTLTSHWSFSQAEMKFLRFCHFFYQQSTEINVNVDIW